MHIANSFLFVCWSWPCGEFEGNPILGFDPSYIFCAFNYGKGTCSGDSGGPVLDMNPK